MTVRRAGFTFWGLTLNMVKIFVVSKKVCRLSQKKIFVLVTMLNYSNGFTVHYPHPRDSLLTLDSPLIFSYCTPHQAAHWPSLSSTWSPLATLPPSLSSLTWGCVALHIFEVRIEQSLQAGNGHSLQWQKWLGLKWGRGYEGSHEPESPDGLSFVQCQDVLLRH